MIGNGVKREDIYLTNREELILALLLDLYLKLDLISVSIYKIFAYSTSYCLLTIFATNYCLKRNVNNFGLRRLLYSK